MDIRLKLKSEFKNYIADGLKIYYSKTRPIVEIINFLPYEIKQQCQIWEEDCHFLISKEEILKKILSDYELKEFDFNIMNFNDNRYITINYETLFDLCSIDLNDFLTKCKVELKHIYPFYKEWVNTQDLIDITNKLINDYFNK